MTREEMLTAMIQRFGFENCETIHFAEMMVTCTDQELKNAMLLAFEYPFRES
jgi:hypothetical protein